jgi:hypothetical protein
MIIDLIVNGAASYHWWAWEQAEYRAWCAAYYCRSLQTC